MRHLGEIQRNPVNYGVGILTGTDSARKCALTLSVSQERIEMSEWQPIETAPKDGRTVLLTDESVGSTPGADDQICFVASWSQGIVGWRDDLSNLHIDRDFTITHWMPLPEPPA